MKQSVLWCLFILAAQPLGGLAQTKTATGGGDRFWKTLQSLCGKAYAGEIRAAPANDTIFTGKKLVMHVRSCQPNRIRIPFFVGADRSRTWILTREADRLRLRHDHRDEDGSPDRVTGYGGAAPNRGTATTQIFPADRETAELLPAAATNVWWIDLTEQHFTYNLRRLGTDRFYSVRFDLTREIEPPPAPPWGWREDAARRLTRHTGQDRYPQFSPDGKQILFESDRNGNWDIFVIGANGRSLRRLTREKSDERHPRWNRSGTHIVFTSDRITKGDPEIYLMRADGAAWRRLTRRPGTELFPALSPDERFVAYTSADLDLQLLELATSRIRPLAPSRFRDVWPRWSADGRRLVFFSRRDTNDRDDEIYLLDFPDGRPKRVTGRDGHDFCPAFSPDGRRLAVAAIDEKLGRSINIIDLEGNIITRLARGFERVTEPDWSPDARRITFAARRSGNYDIYIENLP